MKPKPGLSEGGFGVLPVHKLLEERKSAALCGAENKGKAASSHHLFFPKKRFSLFVPSLFPIIILWFSISAIGS